MTATYSREVARFIATNDYSVVSARVGIIAIVLLMALLIEREMLRAFRPDSRTFTAVKALDVAVLPLLGAFVTILVLRFLELLN